MHEQPAETTISVWRDPLWWGLLGAALLVYSLRLTDLPVSGEETRRGQIAREMLETGNLLVPCVQGVPRMSRPPLQNWLIAASAWCDGGRLSAAAVRWPSVLSMVAAVGLVYWYARCRLSRVSSLVASVATGTMYQMLEFGRLGETEAVFTIFVAASLLVWHRSLLLRGTPSILAWCLTGALIAAGTLTKGIQAPVYAVGAIGIELLLRQQWGWLRGCGVWLGIGSCCLVWGAWQLPFLFDQGATESWRIYFFNVANRFEERRWSAVIGHWLLYPVEMLGAAMAPWSLLLWPLCVPSVWRSLGRLQPLVRYLVLTLVFTFLFVWLPPGSRTRYYMPLFPLVGLLVGVIAELAMSDLASHCGLAWRRLERLVWWLAPITFVTVLSALCMVPANRLTPSIVGSITSLLALGVATWLSRLSAGDYLLPEHRVGALVPRTALVLGLLLVGVYVGPVMSANLARSVDLGAQVERFRREHPEVTTLCSFGQLHHGFLYHWPSRIELRNWPETMDQAPAVGEYFAVHTYRKVVGPLPFQWEQVAVLACDQVTRAIPKDQVWIGRRLPETDNTAAETKFGL